MLEGGEIKRVVFLKLQTLLKRTTVALIVLSKKECRTSYFGGYLGDKQEKMCFKAGCKVKSHKDNMWSFNTLLVSALEQYAFIQVKRNEDFMVWTAIALAFEVVEKNWETLL